MQLDATQKAIDLLDHVSEDVKDNAIWILANISGDSLTNRDTLLDIGIVPKLLEILDGNRYQPSFLAHVAWLMSNLCRGKPYPAFHKVITLSIDRSA